MLTLPYTLVKLTSYNEDSSVGSTLSTFFEQEIVPVFAEQSAKMALTWTDEQDKWYYSPFSKNYSSGWASITPNKEDKNWSVGDVIFDRKGTVSSQDFKTPSFWVKEWEAMGVKAWTDQLYSFNTMNALPVQSFMYDVLFNGESATKTEIIPKFVILSIKANAPLSANCKDLLQKLLYANSALRQKFLQQAFKNPKITDDVQLQIFISAPHFHLHENVSRTIEKPLRLDQPVNYLIFIGNKPISIGQGQGQEQEKAKMSFKKKAFYNL